MPDDFEGARVTGAPEKEASADEIPFEADIKDLSWPVASTGDRHQPYQRGRVHPAQEICRGRREGDEPCPMPRTAYQLVYRDGTFMQDYGPDQETHGSFGSQAESLPGLI